jgi:hypothetical protein
MAVTTPCALPVPNSVAGGTGRIRVEMGIHQTQSAASKYILGSQQRNGGWLVLFRETLMKGD